MEYAPPSAILRAALSLVLLAGFYVLVLGVAVFLLAFPVWLSVRAIQAGHYYYQPLFLLAFGWVPAFALAAGVLGARRSPFVPPGRLFRP